MKSFGTGIATGSMSAIVAEMMQNLAARSRAMLRRGHDGNRRRADGAEFDLVSAGESLLSRRGEASGVVLARLMLDAYARQAPADKRGFLLALADGFGANRELIEEALGTYRDNPNPAAIKALHHATEPRRQELMRRLNLAPGGTAALVRMREDTLGALTACPELKPLDDDFVHLFSSWFNRGFLQLKPIDWTTSASILEKIIRYEAVHAITDWQDLRNRLEPADRRCFGFFHPQLADEPLIFVEVALTRGMSEAIAPLLDYDHEVVAPETATTAVFYSISNTQKGLAGVSFGNFLIKQVVEDLKLALPNLETFVTLSPVPGFAHWLARERKEESSWIDDATRAALALLDEPDWHKDAEKTEMLRPVLVAAAARYYILAKRGDGRPIDPVARFHLGNGARLERINFLGDISAKGLSQSHGLLVNYLYALDDIEKNHELFFEHAEIATGAQIRKMLRDEAAAPSRANGTTLVNAG
ncbi:malonyl-CoA decarboxylase [Methylovirgula sp. HY1]|uniref:malonyl-CoA decarboxylase n=1 Tax=Methylovirgula sp. HY1 TaxID=2822761 RepID=UPI001C760FC6|nr:malonyl-CoA decarboxylase [Methylovirgula sp. HY1]QXX73796.1 hypothetical protein MHY1_00596 [Methylovirgula sp. HY1]